MFEPRRPCGAAVQIRTYISDHGDISNPTPMIHHCRSPLQFMCPGPNVGTAQDRGAYGEDMWEARFIVGAHVRG